MPQPYEDAAWEYPSSLTFLNFRGHQTNLIDTGRVCRVDGAGDHLKLQVWIALHKHNLFGAGFEDVDQTVLKFGPVGIVLIDLQVALLIDDDNDRTVVRVIMLLVRRWWLRRKSVQTVRGHRRDCHEDNEQDKQNIDHGRHVDIALGSAATANCHCHKSKAP